MRLSPMPEMYELLDAKGIGYTIPLPANNVLQHRIGYPAEAPGQATAA
jgi:hypothetical protein